MKTFSFKRWALLLLLLPHLLAAQKKEQQVGDTTYYKTLIPETKQTLLKNMSMIANMRYAFRNEFNDGTYTSSKFSNEQFRLEIRGQVTDKVYFRFRDRYTRAQEPQSLDNLSRSTDMAYIRVDATDKLSISAGKMCADWGGYEFDYNPIDIYEYSDIIEYADNFLSGVGVSYRTNNRNQFTIQVLDSRTKTFTELYGKPPGKVESKAPLAFVANWRGSFFDGKFNTIWSYALHNEAINTFMNYFAFGNELKLGKLTVEYDFKYSIEDLDRTGVVSQVIPDNLYPWAVNHTLYAGHWLHVHYRVSPKVNLALIGMAEIENWNDNTLDPFKTSNHIRNAYGYIPTFEFYPYKNLNLRFFANWVGRAYKYSDYAISRFGASDYNTGRFSIGFVSPLGIF